MHGPLAGDPVDADAIERTAKAVEHVSKQGLTHRNGESPARAPNDAARTDLTHIAERHEQRFVSAKTHHLRGYGQSTAPRSDLAELADPRLGQRCSDDEADRARYETVHLDRTGAAESLEKPLCVDLAHRPTSRSAPASRRAMLSSCVSRRASMRTPAHSAMQSPGARPSSKSTSTVRSRPCSSSSASISGRWTEFMPKNEGRVPPQRRARAARNIANQGRFERERVAEYLPRDRDRETYAVLLEARDGCRLTLSKIERSHGPGTFAFVLTGRAGLLANMVRRLARLFEQLPRFHVRPRQKVLGGTGGSLPRP